MRRIFVLTLCCILSTVVMQAQDKQPAWKAAQAAASEVASAAAEEKAKEPAPKRWKTAGTNLLKFGHTSLTNWAAGGDNTTTLSANIDYSANYAKDAFYGNNRLQLDYGFIYSSSKPILQKNTDRIYLDCTWGKKMVKNLSITVNHNTKSQFTKGYNYATPASKKDDEGNVIEPTRADWRDARKLLSNFLSPATSNLAFGIEYKPKSWITVNFSPITGSYTIVREKSLRSSYGMQLNSHNKQLKEDYASYEIEALPSSLSAGDVQFLRDLKDGKESDYLKGARFDFGTQLKIDLSFVIDKKVTYKSQINLFSNYLDHPENIRVNWDNTINWQFSKYLALNFFTWLTYDDKVMIFSEKDGLKHQRIQFKDQLSLAFTYKF